MTFIPRLLPLLLALLVLLFYGTFSFAQQDEELETILELEMPATRQLMERAFRLTRAGRNRNDYWQAAVNFCKAARLGSIEAQYQLGMLYASGTGVRSHRDYAAALFATAGQQGHQLAQAMLDSMPLKKLQLPGCMLSDKHLPAKSGYRSHSFSFAKDIDIDKLIKKLPPQKTWIIDLVYTMAPWYQIDPRLALSIISIESNFNPNAVSPKNAMGLMQLIPATAERFNVQDAFDAAQNIKAGLRYLRWLLKRYDGDVALAAAGYNAGEGAVDRHKGIPPYPETQAYVARVLNLYKKKRCCDGF
ncbi:MAG: transglycosylase SLT domain-containing protein [Methylomicrobium sp.]|nr:transglycosylase SLT domain-containing protein [Methylomicrobium sp.]